MTSLTTLTSLTDLSNPVNQLHIDTVEACSLCPECNCSDAECICFLEEEDDADKDSLDASGTPPDKPFRFEYAFESITVRGSRFKANRSIY